MTSVRTLLVDLGGVLCHFDPAPRLERLAALSGLPVEDVRAAIYDSGTSERSDLGEIDAAQLRADLGDRLGVSAAGLTDSWATAFTPAGEVLELLAPLRGRVPIGLLTNNDALLRELLPAALPAVAAVIDTTLFSCELKATKPAPAAFRAALDRMGADAATTVFVDDSAANVAAAAALGIDAVRYTDPARLAADLASRGLR